MNGNMAVKLKLSMFETTPMSNVTAKTATIMLTSVTSRKDSLT
jgi:hypothetical protein